MAAALPPAVAPAASSIAADAPPEDAAEAAVLDDFCKFLVEHYGTVLRAWRNVLDPNGDGELLFSEFIEHVATMPPWRGDVALLWTALMRKAAVYDADMVLRLRELSFEEYHAVQEFRAWADQEHIGGATALFKAATEGRTHAAIDFPEFDSMCRRFGYTGDTNKMFWGCLVQQGSESINLPDMAYLESDALKRKGILDPTFNLMQDAAKAMAKRMRRRKRRLKMERDTAMREFFRQVRRVSGGSFVRGWRRILDQSGNLAISKTELLKGCKRIAFDGDVVALWKAMDNDDDGIVMLEEVNVNLVLILAGFKRWALEEHGSCIGAIARLAAGSKRKSPKFPPDEWLDVMRHVDLRRPANVSQKVAVMTLYEAFDVENNGHFIPSDAGFLDRWTPTPWLLADPSYEDRDQFLRHLRTLFPNLLVAWRKVLDKGNSNRVSYKEFKENVKSLRLNNVLGTWRALDQDNSGFISIGEIDEEAAATLLHFKRWAEVTFGTIQRMFYVFDSARSGKVSFPVFRRALRNFACEVDVGLLYRCLKPDGNGKGKRDKNQRELTLNDMLYLSTWESDPGKDNDLSDEEESERAPEPEASPSNRAVRKEESRAAKEASERLQSHRQPKLAKTRSKQEVDTISYCRSANEYKAFAQVTTGATTGRARDQEIADTYLPPVVAATPKGQPKGLSRSKSCPAGKSQATGHAAVPELPKLLGGKMKFQMDHLASLGVLRQSQR